MRQAITLLTVLCLRIVSRAQHNQAGRTTLLTVPQPLDLFGLIRGDARPSLDVLGTLSRFCCEIVGLSTTSLLFPRVHSQALEKSARTFLCVVSARDTDSGQLFGDFKYLELLI